MFPGSCRDADQMEQHSPFSSSNSSHSESSPIASSTTTTLLAGTASPAQLVSQTISTAGASSSSSSNVNVGEVSSTCSVGSPYDTVSSSPGYINTESSVSSLDDLKSSEDVK
uniref:Uncharacterized protein n=1 Tax=Anopheles quadriannulatus TaxID=34691 RepID=A0A182X4F5_ANOQN